MKPLEVLLVEDNPGDARLLREMFKEQGSHDTQLTQVGSMREAEGHLATQAFDNPSSWLTWMLPWVTTNVMPHRWAGSLTVLPAGTSSTLAVSKYGTMSTAANRSADIDNWSTPT